MSWGDTYMQRTEGRFRSGTVNYWRLPDLETVWSKGINTIGQLLCLGLVLCLGLALVASWAILPPRVLN